MAAGSLLALLDDIASVLDDVSLLTKAATKKTAGVLGDDLALNAQQVTGVRANRELPVVWAVAKGSLVNKAILVPAALAISAFAPWAVTPLLMLGGLFLCYEGFEKLAHKLFHSREEDEARHIERKQALVDPAADFMALERDKIKGAVRTDFILSAEIIVIALGTVASQSLLTRVLVLTGIALIMTVGVYGLVAAIVKLDDVGLHLTQRSGEGVVARMARGMGAAILWVAPRLMKFLSIAGTAAMFLVGGGILVHGVPTLHHWVDHAGEWLAAQVAALSGLLDWLAPLLGNLLVGIAAGAVAVAAVSLVKLIWPSRAQGATTSG
jgi:predicted DNA repair protein MutK